MHDFSFLQSMYGANTTNSPLGLKIYHTFMNLFGIKSTKSLVDHA
jgi:hypothetical protein